MKSGVINFLKPVGMTSSDAVGIVRKATGIKKVGHLGTLDPLASGVLPIAFGKATRLFDVFLQKKKMYIAMFDFSYSTDTLDNDGEITARCDKIVTKEDVEKVLPQFVGKVEQYPPKYSAKNVGGERAYDLARAGKQFELSPSVVEIYSLKLLRKEGNGFVFEIVCSAGTYIRSLAKDIGEKLGACGTMTALIRTESGNFSLRTAVTKEELLSGFEKYAVSAEDAMSDYPMLCLNGDDAFKVQNGVSIPVCVGNGLYRLYLDGIFVGAIEVENNKTGERVVIDD